MATAVRAAGSIAAGLALALALVIAVELVSAVVHPVPEGFTGTQEEMCEHVANYPHWILALVVVAWGGTAFVSTWLAGRIGNPLCGGFVGLLLLAAAGSNVVMLPYPMWFKVVILIAIPAAIYFALRASRRREPVVRSA